MAMIATAEQATTNIYQPFGAAKRLMHCWDREVLLHGPANTGKSMAALVKLYINCELFPGMRGFIGRKYRASLTDSALVTWEERVLPRNHQCLRGPARTQRHVYTFPNKSTVTVIGLDEAEKQKSTEYDMGFLQEASELLEDDLTPVVRGMRYGVMPYQQLILDVNPQDPDHWLRKRFGIDGFVHSHGADVITGDGKTALYSRHEDNPELYDHDLDGNVLGITLKGAEYLAELDKIPNTADRMRLRHGLWAGAEGRVYDGWEATRDVVDAKTYRIAPEWPRYMGIDFGFRNLAALFYALNPDTGQLILYDEYFAGGRSAGQHIPFLTAKAGCTPFTVGGAKAEGQWRLEFLNAGLRIHEPLIKEVALGISRVNGQHKRAGILVFDTCTGYLEEKSSYRYLPDAADPEAIERKRHFHFMDAERYIVGYLRPEVSDVKLSPGRNGVALAVRQEA